MAKNIKFNVILSIDDKEHLVTATTDVKNLRNALGFCVCMYSVGLWLSLRPPIFNSARLTAFSSANPLRFHGKVVSLSDRNEKNR